MPSFPFTPAQLRYVGGNIALEPIRFIFTPGRTDYTGGSVAIGPDFSSDLSVDGVRLDRLTRAVSISDQGLPSIQFQALWQRNCEATEAALEALQQQVDFLGTIIASIQAAQAAAAQANQGVETLNAGVSLSSSRTEPVDGLLTATSDGVVTISAHERVYTTGTTESRVSVDAGSVSGFAAGAFVRIYYNDAARMGGAVAYQGTTEEVTQTGDVHVIGGVAIPQAGSPPSSGTGTTPPGYVRPSQSFEPQD